MYWIVSCSTQLTMISPHCLLHIIASSLFTIDNSSLASYEVNICSYRNFAQFLDSLSLQLYSAECNTNTIKGVLYPEIHFLMSILIS